MKILKKINFLVVIAIILSNSAIAQIFTRPLPKSWVSKFDCIERSMWFRIGNYKPGGKSKDDIFKEKTGMPAKNIFFSNKSIDDLINKIEAVVLPFDHINIYLGLYVDDPSCPQDMKKPGTNDVVLVFAPAERKRDEHGNDIYVDVGSYFMVDKNEACHEIINKQCFDKWIKEYVDKLSSAKDGLASTIDPTKNENILPDGTISDTRRLTYSYESFLEFWKEERKHLVKKNINISGIRVDFVQYTDRGMPEKRGKFQYRLHLQFELIQEISSGNQVDYYQEDTKNFHRRYKKYLKEREKDSLLSPNGGNHGQLCPNICL